MIEETRELLRFLIANPAGNWTIATTHRETIIETSTHKIHVRVYENGLINTWLVIDGIYSECDNIQTKGEDAILVKKVYKAATDYKLLAYKQTINRLIGSSKIKVEEIGKQKKTKINQESNRLDRDV